MSGTGLLARQSDWFVDHFVTFVIFCSKRLEQKVTKDTKEYKAQELQKLWSIAEIESFVVHYWTRTLAASATWRTLLASANRLTGLETRPTTSSLRVTQAVDLIETVAIDRFDRKRPQFTGDNVVDFRVLP